MLPVYLPGVPGSTTVTKVHATPEIPNAHNITPQEDNLLHMLIVPPHSSHVHSLNWDIDPMSSVDGRYVVPGPISKFNRHKYFRINYLPPASSPSVPGMKLSTQTVDH